MQECPESPQGVVNKELNSKPQMEDYNYCLALLCVGVCVWVSESVFVCRLRSACVYVCFVCGTARLVIVPTWLCVNICWTSWAILNFHKSWPCGLSWSFLFTSVLQIEIANGGKKTCILCSGHIFLPINTLCYKDQKVRLLHVYTGVGAAVVAFRE